MPKTPAPSRRPEWRSPLPALVINSQQPQAEYPIAKRWQRLGAIAGWLGLVSLSCNSGSALATLPSDISATDWLIQPSTQAVIPFPIAEGSPPTRVRPEVAGETAPPTEAPSVLWLIVMPAVPTVGGAVIYLSRRLLGRPSGECRLVTQVPPPESSDLEIPTLEKTDTSQDP